MDLIENRMHFMSGQFFFCFCVFLDIGAIHGLDIAQPSIIKIMARLRFLFIYLFLYSFLLLWGSVHMEGTLMHVAKLLGYVFQH